MNLCTQIHKKCTIYVFTDIQDGYNYSVFIQSCLRLTPISILSLNIYLAERCLCSTEFSGWLNKGIGETVSNQSNQIIPPPQKKK